MIIDNVQINADLINIIIELKNELQLNGIEYFHKIRDVGKDVQVCCPYHKDGQERKPSAGIRKEDGLFHCFTCGEVHSLHEVISHCFGKNDNGVYGWSWIIKNFGMIEKEERKDVEIDFSRNKRNIKSSILDDNYNSKFFVSEKELKKYRYIHPYMYKRRLTDEIIELFDIGYDRINHCITFPVRDKVGNCLFIARRSIRTKFFSYPKGVEKPLYGLYELTKHFKPYGIPEEESLIVCESMLDALTAWVYGKYAVALNGLGNQLQFKQLRDLPCRELILATDNDEAGAKARARIRENVSNKLIREYDYNSFPAHAKDLNDLSKEEFYALEKIF